MNFANSVKVLQIPDSSQPDKIFVNFVVQSGHILHTTQSSEAKGLCSVYSFQDFINGVWLSRQIPAVTPRRIPTCSSFRAGEGNSVDLTVGFLDMTGEELPMIPKLLAMHEDKSFAQHERFHGGYLELRQNAFYRTVPQVFVALALFPGVPKGSYQEPVILHLPWQECSAESGLPKQNSLRVIR
ncbi:MAG: hypothetical protein F6J86_06650 [Symploca sp. SIO1B1]|nr:hypothetical protein [Symploca sp. SIO1B1]